jgi:hypothetical protein
MISFMVDMAVQVSLASWVSATGRKPTPRGRHNDLNGM